MRERDPAARRKAINYLEEESAASSVVILAPGVYYQDKRMTLDTKLPNVTIYAYGVLLEKEGYNSGTIYFEETDHLTVKGLSIGHTVNSSGNAVIIGKRDGRYIEAIGGAGLLQDWTDSNYYSFTGLSQSVYGYRPGHAEPYADMSSSAQFYDAQTGIMTLTVSEAVYARMQVGDTITCRGAGGQAIQATRNDSLSLIDVTVYGAPGFCLNDSHSYGDGITLVRMLDTTAATPVIDQSTYEG